MLLYHQRFLNWRAFLHWKKSKKRHWRRSYYSMWFVDLIGWGWARYRRWLTDGSSNHLPSKVPALFPTVSIDDFPDGCVTNRTIWRVWLEEGWVCGQTGGRLGDQGWVRALGKARREHELKTHHCLFFHGSMYWTFHIVKICRSLWSIIRKTNNPALCSSPSKVHHNKSMITMLKYNTGNTFQNVWSNNGKVKVIYINHCDTKYVMLYNRVTLIIKWGWESVERWCVRHSL